MSTLFHLAAFGFLLIPISVLTAQGASAQEATCNLDGVAASVRAEPENAVTLFNNMREDRCFSVSENRFGQQCKTSVVTDPLCDIIGKWSEDTNKSTPIADVYDILTRIKTVAEGLDQTAGPVAKFLDSVEGIEPHLGENAIQFARDTNNTARWDEASDALPGLDIELEEELGDGSPCATPVDQDRCVAAFETLAHVYTLARFQKTVFSALLAEDRAAVEDYITTVSGRWQTYLNDSRGILPWELVLNGFFFKPERGFNEPPSGQLIALHPSTGVEIGDRDDDDLEPIITLELIGYYGWRWEGQEMKAPVRLPGFLDDFPWGASLLLAFDGDNDPGFGGNLHLPRNWSIGAVVDTDGEVTGLVSVDLAKLEFFSGSKKSIKSELLKLFK